MIQAIIDKHFFNLLIFTLVFGILLYDAIGFDYTDEICALFLFILFSIYLFSTKGWDFNKAFLTTIGIFLFYFCYSLYIGSNTKTAILSDMLIQIKKLPHTTSAPPLLMRQLYPHPSYWYHATFSLAWADHLHTLFATSSSSVRRYASDFL